MLAAWLKQTKQIRRKGVSRKKRGVHLRKGIVTPLGKITCGELKLQVVENETASGNEITEKGKPKRKGNCGPLKRPPEGGQAAPKEKPPVPARPQGIFL